jgi:hypothetical protein
MGRADIYTIKPRRITQLLREITLRFASDGYRAVKRGRSLRFGSNVVIADAPLDVLPIHGAHGSSRIVVKNLG